MMIKKKLHDLINLQVIQNYLLPSDLELTKELVLEVACWVLLMIIKEQNYIIHNKFLHDVIVLTEQ